MQWLPAILILPYFIILLRTYKNLLHPVNYHVSSDPEIFVSVVVACRNEEKRLPALLESLALQNYPKSLFEVIIIDDNSSDKTSEITRLSYGIENIYTINNIGKGKKLALRTGISAAQGNLIITTDADCMMGKNWIKTIASYYETYKPDLIICPVKIKPSAGFLGKFSELEFMSLQGITAGTALSGEAIMCNGANLAFTRQAYLSHSKNMHYEINSGDDIFLLHSLKKEPQSKISWLESQDALVDTESPSTLKMFLKQRSRWISKGKAYNDIQTIILGIVTFVAILLQVSYMIAAVIAPSFIGVFLTLLILKSIPDFLILLNTTARYGNKKLMKWFLASQIIYPFYVLSVVFYSLIFREKWRINSPSPKETLSS
jgi:poly-beta-1,6-N-acetyl-D-glucosamine synthase